MLKNSAGESFAVKRFVAAIASAFAAMSMANAATIVEDPIILDSTEENVSVTLTLEAGLYEVSFLDAWNAWGDDEDDVAGCDETGANCDRGWLTNVDVRINGKYYTGVRNGKFDSAANAVANSSPFALDLRDVTDAVEVTFFLIDNYYDDNFGELSLQIESASMPVPAAGLLFLGGVAAYNAARRRR